MNDFITTCRCDHCDNRGPAVALHDGEEEVLALCQRCAPQHFESVARRDIDEWLSKGEENDFSF